MNASFVTIANNDAGSSGKGGGIFNTGTGTVNIKNSIVGDNTAGGGGPNCSGGVIASGTNLATDTTTMSCGMTNFTHFAAPMGGISPVRWDSSSGRRSFISRACEGGAPCSEGWSLRAGGCQGV